MSRRIKLLSIFLAIVIILLSGLAAMSYGPVKEKHANLIRVACIGDSITKGFDYPNYLWMLLGSEYTVGNFGVGASTISLGSQKSYMKQPEFQNVSYFEPDVVIVMLGTNDAHPSNQQYTTSFSDDYIKLLTDLLHLNNKPSIWIVKPPPVFYNGTGISTEFFDTFIIPHIEEVAHKLTLPIIDVYTSLALNPGYFIDGVHPTVDGSQAIAKIIYNALIQQN